MTALLMATGKGELESVQELLFSDARINDVDSVSINTSCTC